MLLVYYYWRVLVRDAAARLTVFYPVIDVDLEYAGPGHVEKLEGAKPRIMID